MFFPIQHLGHCCCLSFSLPALPLHSTPPQSRFLRQWFNMFYVLQRSQVFAAGKDGIAKACRWSYTYFTITYLVSLLFSQSFQALQNNVFTYLQLLSIVFSQAHLLSNALLQVQLPTPPLPHPHHFVLCFSLSKNNFHEHWLLER